ncbi:MAG: type II toxin-antitoxin system VapC family toxin [Planctomycetaceae bacterium]
MSVFVVDASVGIKWFLPEVHSAEARQWRTIGELHTPEFFAIEIANILWKKVRRNEITRAEADAVWTQVPNLPIVRHQDVRLLNTAFDLAHQTERTVYDCLYIALAVQLGGEMITADQRLLNGLSTSPIASHVRWVGDVP